MQDAAKYYTQLCPAGLCVPSVEIDDRGFMTAGANKSQQVVGGDGRRLGVDQWVKVGGLVTEKSAIDHEAYCLGLIINDGKRCYCTRLDTEVAHQSLGAREGETVGTEAFGQLIQIHVAILFAGHQPHASFFVAQKQVLGMRPGQLAANGLGFGDRVDGWVI